MKMPARCLQLIIKKQITIAILFAALLFSTASCKKENTTEPLPVLGTCKAVNTKGDLSYINAAGPYTYKTKGGGNIKIDLDGDITITHDGYPGFQIDFWGFEAGTGRIVGNHETLNGKHIKDRIELRRSFIFPDGAKITFASPDTFAQLLFISIYEVSQCHHINVSCSKLEYSTADNAAMVKRLDDAQADGETGKIEFTTDGLIFDNIYIENTPGNKVMNRVPLGEIKKANPTLVRDYFDDPRLGHT